MLIWTRFYQKCPHNKGILDFYRTDVVFCIGLPDSTDTKLSAISLFHFPHCYCHHLEILRYHQLSILWSPASPHSINHDDQNYDQSLGQWDSCDVKCEEAQWDLLDREEDRIPNRFFNETQHHSISHQSTILSHANSIAMFWWRWFWRWRRKIRWWWVWWWGYWWWRWPGWW